NSNQKKICILSAAFNENVNLAYFYNNVKKVIELLPYDFEIMLVDDGSSDGTLEIIKDIAQNDASVKYISLAQNCGQQVALKAGIDHINADAIIMMDCDMQHPPEFIPNLIETWLKTGANVVNTIREEDYELSWFKRITSKYFYKALNLISDIKLEAGQADFRLIDQSITKNLKKVNRKDIFLRGMINRIECKKILINYSPQKRYAGTTKYTFPKMLKLALSGITSFSNKPLYTIIYTGFFIAFLSLLYLPYVIVTEINGNAVSGWGSLLMSVAFFGGFNLVILGIYGIYIGKILFRDNDIPLYEIDEKNY
ncbi:MAG: glycosyltransferase family 2 protein, partial [Pseudarcicella sp.]|nr:glycosyltransferase family 2 protein [Pseudarcicella sp.]